MKQNKKNVKIRFVYLSNKSSQGSTVMRSFQLVQMLQPFLESVGDVGVEKIMAPTGLVPKKIAFPFVLRKWAKGQPSGAILIFTKACLRILTPETLDILRRKGCKICFDHVDSDFTETSSLAADVHVCSSYAQQAAIISHQKNNPAFVGKAMVLLHNYDASLLQHPPSQEELFRCGYIGTPSMTYIPSEVTSHVEIVSALGKEGWEAALQRISDFSFHYCLRLPQENPRLIKPFTKGFIAAKLGCPIIVNAQTDDAEKMLGSDYPYLLGDLNDRSIVETLNKAKYDFGGPTWSVAKDRMDAVRDAVEPQSLAKQLNKIVTYLTEL